MPCELVLVWLPADAFLACITRETEVALPRVVCVLYPRPRFHVSFLDLI